MNHTPFSTFLFSVFFTDLDLITIKSKIDALKAKLVLCTSVLLAWSVPNIFYPNCLFEPIIEKLDSEGENNTNGFPLKSWLQTAKSVLFGNHTAFLWWLLITYFLKKIIWHIEVSPFLVSLFIFPPCPHQLLSSPSFLSLLTLFLLYSLIFFIPEIWLIISMSLGMLLLFASEYSLLKLEW